MSSCNTAFAKHMFPLFISPRARRCGSAAWQVGPEDVVPSKRERDPAFSEGRKWDGGEEAGTEKSTTDEAGGKGLEAEAASASQEIDDSFGTRRVDSGTGSGVSVGAGVDAVYRISVVSGSVHGVSTSSSVVPSSGQDNVAVGGMSCSALGDDASVGCGPV